MCLHCTPSSFISNDSDNKSLDKGDCTRKWASWTCNRHCCNIQSNKWVVQLPAVISEILLMVLCKALPWNISTSKKLNFRSSQIRQVKIFYQDSISHKTRASTRLWEYQNTTGLISSVLVHKEPVKSKQFSSLQISSYSGILNVGDTNTSQS